MYICHIFLHLPVSLKRTQGVNEPVVVWLKNSSGIERIQAQRSPPFFHLFTGSVAGRLGGERRGDTFALGGALTSCKACVGHEPMHDRQPTHCSSTTTTGRFAFVRSGGDSNRGSNASKGQCAMHKSHPVQSDSMIATIDCPMVLATRHAS
jgi:hypothetical protein